MACRGFVCVKGTIWLDLPRWLLPLPGGSCTHCIRTDSRPAARGALLWDGSRMVARSGRCTAMLSMSQTTGARTRAICCPFHLHSHLKPCQQLPFAPSRKLILRHPQARPPELRGVQLAGHMVSEFDLEKKTKNKGLLPSWVRFQGCNTHHKLSCCSLHLWLHFSGARLSHFH